MTTLWAVLDILFWNMEDGVFLLATSDIPCHLYMRESENYPEIHKTPIIVRGVPFKSDVRFCFDVYHDINQFEDGDSLIHTFWKAPWLPCETKYFYFWGTINNITSRSSSAIFSYHRPVPPADLLHYESWRWWGTPLPRFTKKLIAEPWSS